MKKLLLGTIVLFMSIAASAQKIIAKQGVYCEMTGSGNFSGNKIKVSFDFGNQGFSYKANNDNQLTDEKGDPIKFSSMIEALN